VVCTKKEHEVEEVSLKSSTKEPSVEKKPIMKTKFTRFEIFKQRVISTCPPIMEKESKITISVATLLWPSVGVKPNTWKK
jgi:hypothetical protein